MLIETITFTMWNYLKLSNLPAVEGLSQIEADLNRKVQIAYYAAALLSRFDVYGILLLHGLKILLGT